MKLFTFSNKLHFINSNRKRPKLSFESFYSDAWNLKMMALFGEGAIIEHRQNENSTESLTTRVPTLIFSGV